jgi:urease gamma subunit
MHGNVEEVGSVDSTEAAATGMMIGGNGLTLLEPDAIAAMVGVDGIEGARHDAQVAQLMQAAQPVLDADSDFVLATLHEPSEQPAQPEATGSAGAVVLEAQWVHLQPNSPKPTSRPRAYRVFRRRTVTSETEESQPTGGGISANRCESPRWLSEPVRSCDDEFSEYADGDGRADRADSSERRKLRKLRKRRRGVKSSRGR